MIFKEIKSKLIIFGIKFSDLITRFVSSWGFVLIYTSSMIIWILLHKLDYLHIDGPDFIKWNLWLSYFAGTQASIILMNTTRQSKIDRAIQNKSLELDELSYKMAKLNQERMKHLANDLSMLEDLIEDLIREKATKEDDGTKK